MSDLTLFELLKLLPPSIIPKARVERDGNLFPVVYEQLFWKVKGYRVKPIRKPHPGDRRHLYQYSEELRKRDVDKSN